MRYNKRGYPTNAARRVEGVGLYYAAKDAAFLVAFASVVFDFGLDFDSTNIPNVAPTTAIVGLTHAGITSRFDAVSSSLSSSS